MIKRLSTTSVITRVATLFLLVLEVAAPKKW